jgi:peptidoglycan/LPS O-acetylase OafA/YrhL
MLALASKRGGRKDELVQKQRDASGRLANSMTVRDRILAILEVNSVAGRASSYHLDTIRGLAAFAVFFSHVRHVFYIDYHELDQKTLANSIVYGVTNLGHEAVIVFFVLSGFLIGASVLRLECQGRWSWSNYLINRISRLHVVLVPALLLGLIWDQSGMRLTSEASLYTGHAVSSVLNASIRSRESVTVFLGNLFCLQTVLVPTFGSNSPLWSLANEFWYYMLFPFVVFACVPWTRIGSRIVSMIVIAILLYALGSSISAYFPIWLMGVLANLVPRQSPKHESLMMAGSALVLLVTLAFLSTGRVSGSGPDLFLGLSCASFIHATVQDRRQIRIKSTYAQISRQMASCSYTLYLVHLPILAFICAFWLHGTRWEPNRRSFVAGLLITLVVFGYALFVAFFTERRTDAVRRLLLGQRAPRESKLDTAVYGSGGC